MTEWLAFLLFIQEISRSNLDLESGYPERFSFLKFPVHRHIFFLPSVLKMVLGKRERERM
jgi:hypothetical protein